MKLQKKTNKALSIKIDGNGQLIKVPFNTTIKKLVSTIKINKGSPIIAAQLNGRLVELNHKLIKDSRITLLDSSSEDAIRIYRRGLCFILLKAVKKVFPKNNLVVKHSVSGGLYCTFAGGTPVFSEKDLLKLKIEMAKIVKSRTEFIRKEVPIKKAIQLFSKRKMFDKVRLFRFLNKETVHLYHLGDMVNYFYGYLPPDTGYLDKYELDLMSPGFILRYPTEYSSNEVPPFKHQVKLLDIFREYESWAKALDIEDVGSVNRIISQKQDSELVQIAEAMHEKKISSIAERITNNFHRVRVILVAGPSSSGKTTFTKRLALHLKANGLKLIQISLDNYFQERDKTPRDPNGEFNFEVIEALDLDLFNKHLRLLISGKTVELPKYDFKLGKKFPSGVKMKINSDQLILIEGIHGLNDKLTFSIPQEKKFKVYVSPLTHLNFDNNNIVSSTDVRLIRRIVRDNFFRGYTADKTIAMWPKVRKGERDNIFVFVDDADVLFNTSLVYEMAVFKSYIEPLLENIPVNSPYYNEARRLLSFTSLFLPLNCPKEIPPTSLLREFIGNSAFKY